MITLTHAMILAAGLGTRMRPLTNDIPKPLIEVQGKALIDWCVDWLKQADIRNIVVNSSYRAAQLEAHLQSQSDVRIRISREEAPPLETGGGVLNALPILGQGPFVTLNCDAIFAPHVGVHPLRRMQEVWSANHALDFLMLLVPVSRAIGWQGSGDFLMDEVGRIRRPSAGEIASHIFTGVEIIHPRVFTNCGFSGAFSLAKLWEVRREEDGFFRNIRAVVHEGDWLNVGDLVGLAVANRYAGLFRDE